MYREYFYHRLIDLGAASRNTKGGPLGFIEAERSMYISGGGLDFD
jgi:hypothetical protein